MDGLIRRSNPDSSGGARERGRHRSRRPGYAGAGLVRRTRGSKVTCALFHQVDEDRGAPIDSTAAGPPSPARSARPAPGGSARRGEPCSVRRGRRYDRPAARARPNAERARPTEPSVRCPRPWGVPIPRPRSNGCERETCRRRTPRRRVRTESLAPTGLA